MHAPKPAGNSHFIAPFFLRSGFPVPAMGGFPIMTVFITRRLKNSPLFQFAWRVLSASPSPAAPKYSDLAAFAGGCAIHWNGNMLFSFIRDRTSINAVTHNPGIIVVKNPPPAGKDTVTPSLPLKSGEAGFTRINVTPRAHDSSP